MSNDENDELDEIYVLPGGGSFTRTEWIPPTNMDYEQWAAIGKGLRDINGSLNWWLGDWINCGEQRYGEMYAQAIEVTGHSVDQLRVCSWVARLVKSPTRIGLLSWTHHRMIAYLPERIQRLLLDEATNENWSKQGSKIARG